MPEGDTIHKVAGYLGPRLCGTPLVAVAMADRAAAKRCTGRNVSGVSAHGKHLFIELDDAMAIRSHLGIAMRTVSAGRNRAARLRWC